jgi:hypothetical protein
MKSQNVQLARYAYAQMQIPISYLASADRSPWTESLAKSDGLPAPKRSVD